MTHTVPILPKPRLQPYHGHHRRFFDAGVVERAKTLAIEREQPQKKWGNKGKWGAKAKEEGYVVRVVLERAPQPKQAQFGQSASHQLGAENVGAHYGRFNRSPWREARALGSPDFGSSASGEKSLNPIKATPESLLWCEWTKIENAL